MFTKNRVFSVLLVFVGALFLCSCAPKVTDFTPKSGGEGTEVTIDGKNFKSSAEANTVKFGDVTAPDILAAGKTKIIVKVPAGAQTGKISVTTSGGTGESSGDFFIDGGNKGHALAIGLNSVDPAHYGGWSGDLSGCEPDARDMQYIASQQGFSAETMLTAQATRDNVLNKLSSLAGTLQSGDLLVLSYSGHGGQIPDQNGDETDDGLDETWCLYDGEMLDDELYGAWANFQPGVRILVFSDSCHSGTVLRMLRPDWDDAAKMEKHKKEWEGKMALPQLRRVEIRSFIESKPELKLRVTDARARRAAVKVKPAETAPEIELFEVRSIPPSLALAVFEQNRTFYEDIGKAAPREDSGTIQAAVILISGCEDHQTSGDLGFNGLFTSKLKQVWNNGQFTGNHTQFHEAIKQAVLQWDSFQSPNLFTIGVPSGVQVFLNRRPYSVN